MKTQPPKTIEEMRIELQRQILETALQSDNPQYKLDVFKAVQERATKATKQAMDEAPAPDGMAVFQARVRKAEGGNGPDDAH